MDVRDSLLKPTESADRTDGIHHIKHLFDSILGDASTDRPAYTAEDTLITALRNAFTFRQTPYTHALRVFSDIRRVILSTPWEMGASPAAFCEAIHARLHTIPDCHIKDRQKAVRVLELILTHTYTDDSKSWWKCQTFGWALFIVNCLDFVDDGFPIAALGKQLHVTLTSLNISLHAMHAPLHAIQPIHAAPPPIHAPHMNAAPQEVKGLQLSDITLDAISFAVTRGLLSSGFVQAQKEASTADETEEVPLWAEASPKSSTVEAPLVVEVKVSSDDEEEKSEYEEEVIDRSKPPHSNCDISGCRACKEWFHHMIKKPDTCMRCLKTGHVVSVCSNEIAQSTSRCHVCGFPKHGGRRCVMSGNNVCSRCQAPGHKPSVCPSDVPAQSTYIRKIFTKPPRK